MNMNIKPETNDELDRILRQWTVAAPLPRRFQERVWQRIERAEAKPVMSVRPWLQRLMEGVVPQPRFAYVYLSALLVAGVAAGFTTAQIKADRLDSELSMRYVHSVDPYRADTSAP